MQPKRTKTKHNKKRNTAFLYESILLELTKSVLERNESKKASLLKLCREFFSAGKILKKELDLYKAINETCEMDKHLAERVLMESKYQYSLLNKDQIFHQQTKLINKINKEFDGSPFSNFVPQYKNLATISQIFGDNLPVKEKVLLENTLIEKMSAGKQTIEETKLEPIDNLTYKTFVKKFNEQYDAHLLKEQKDLITQYVMSFGDSGLEFKLFLNEEISRIKNELNKSLLLKEISEDQLMVQKTKKILSLVESYSERPIEPGMIKEILKIQSLLSEVRKDG